MVVLQYNGLNVGTQTFVGDVSGTKYRFGGKRVKGYVAVEDVEGLLSLTKKKRILFKRPPPPKPKPKKKPVKPKPPPEYAPAPVEVVEADTIHDEHEDLTVLSGVGQTTADRLREAGYITVAQIAGAVPGELSERVSGLSFGRAMSLRKAAAEYAS
jgi:predicted flap endonuclease-1-like 5' DNA nuclease